MRREGGRRGRPDCFPEIQAELRESHFAPSLALFLELHQTVFWSCVVSGKEYRPARSLLAWSFVFGRTDTEGLQGEATLRSLIDVGVGVQWSPDRACHSQSPKGDTGWWVLCLFWES